MRYAVPVNAPDEVAALAAAGAGELYCGYQDAWWTQRYGDHDSASRRQGVANLVTPDDLAHCAEQARTHGLPLWLALNSRYTEPQLDRLVELCRQFEAVGGTGVIASDLGLLWRLRTATDLRRCLSLLAVAQNRTTIAAYLRLDVSRVVFPRFVRPSEASRLLSVVPATEAEVMAFFDKCPWVDGYCRHRHGVTYPPREVPGDMDDAPPLYTFDTTYRTHACLGKACAYLEPYPCAACHLAAFAQAGVGVAKLGGRGRPLDERLLALRFLVAAEACATDDERVALYRKTFAQPCACYYGAATQRRDAIEPVADPPETAGMRVLGSQTSLDVFREALSSVVEAATSVQDPPVLLVPPLDDRNLIRLMQALLALRGRRDCRFVAYVNDLGTLISLARLANDTHIPLSVGAGTLLLRQDDPVEVARALDPAANPPRAVWGPDGEPRVLTYRRPPHALVDHWKRPSLLEPSTQEALRFLLSQ